MERRRGDSYLGKDFSQPPGLPEDVHVAEKIECVDCHETGPGGMGHIKREASCQNCHLEVEEALAASVHKNVSCEACHVKILGGYEMTSWGPGKIESRPNPFKKYSLYYGPQEPPILIRDQGGRWIPVKIWPNSVGGIKEPVAPKPGLTFRWPDGETRDAYAQLGTFTVPEGNNRYLAWLQVEQVGHPLGKSRSCKSCHGSDTQTAKVTWEYFDTQGAEPFTGSQTVVAGREGLSVRDITATSPIVPMDGARFADFAAWRLLGDIWQTRGDFSIPQADPRKYSALVQDIDTARARLDGLDREIATREAKGGKMKKPRRRWKEAAAAAVHDPAGARVLMDEASRMLEMK